FFFFSWCGSHCDLLSFPTRRSSDLCSYVEHIFHEWRDWRPRSLNARIGRNFHSALRLLNAKFFELEKGVAHQRDLPKVARAVGLDRKSTRLNSSHVKISYAVFCLKK